MTIAITLIGVLLLAQAAAGFYVAWWEREHPRQYSTHDGQVFDGERILNGLTITHHGCVVRDCTIGPNRLRVIAGRIARPFRREHRLFLHMDL
ncbi:MAG: hypothetical protein AAGA90_23280 [Actinomycetota bacterium]